ncbi:cache domain-containing protein [Vibrio cholerae]|nr:cache domain-containing protein [Vibrio cholerae]
MKTLSLKWKFLTGGIVPVALLAMVLVLTTYISQTNSLERETKEYRHTLIQERKNNIKDVVIVASQMVSNSIESSAEDKKEVTAQVLQDAFFSGKNGYFFVFDENGNFVSHPLKPEAVGTSGLGLTDPDGVKITVELQKAAKRGGDFIEYIFNKPGSEVPVAKIGYAFPIEGTEWFIGSGLYIDDIEEQIAVYQQGANKRMIEQISTILITSSIVLTLIALMIVFFVGRLVRPIRAILNTMETIADGEGDLTKRLDILSKDELGQLAAAFNKFMDTLHNIISQVTTTASKVSHFSLEIEASSLSTNSQLQKHDVETEHIVTAMNQMSTTANEVASNINQVSNATALANSDSILAKDVVAKCVDRVSILENHLVSSNEKVNSLKEQTNKIDEVLEVIGDIAEQTNLLALNAAIESARAGEQGRGFAVVADEVRKLARRTQDSTLSIKDMLDTLHSLVTEVVNSMNSSRQNCQDVVSSTQEIDQILSKTAQTIDSINQMTDQISTAATEQSAVTEEINQTMFKLRDIVVHLLNTSETAHGTAIELKSSGQSLSDQVGQFKLT